MGSTISSKVISYEDLLEEAAKECKCLEITEKQNLRIIEELNQGMGDFVLDQKMREGKARLELGEIFITH